MFGSLVESVALCESEIWRWQRDERVDRIDGKYTKRILGLHRGIVPIVALCRNGDWIDDMRRKTPETRLQTS